MKLSKHFSSNEFACNCQCGFEEVNPELIDVLEDLREAYGMPITINSGCRCPIHNKAVGGEPNSEHMKGTAADISMTGMPTIKIKQYLDNKYPNKYGIGLYKTWVHIDVRSKRARWSK